jgi:hypothetical protein
VFEVLALFVVSTQPTNEGYLVGVSFLFLFNLPCLRFKIGLGLFSLGLFGLGAFSLGLFGLGALIRWFEFRVDCFCVLESRFGAFGCWVEFHPRQCEQTLR